MAEGYKIVHQAPTTIISPGGQVVPAMEITFETEPNHVAGKVRVPIDKYTTDEVGRVVAAQAHMIERVQAL